MKSMTNRWLKIFWPIDYSLIAHWFHWCHWCHQFLTSGKGEQCLLDKMQWAKLKKKNGWKRFSGNIFKVHSQLQLVLVLFWRFPEILGKSRIPRRPPFGNHDIITTPYDVINSHCGSQRKHLWTCFLFSKAHCQSFCTYHIIDGAGIDFLCTL